jgi:hypothetical protein
VNTLLFVLLRDRRIVRYSMNARYAQRMAHGAWSERGLMCDSKASAGYRSPGPGRSHNLGIIIIARNIIYLWGTLGASRNMCPNSTDRVVRDHVRCPEARDARMSEIWRDVTGLVKRSDVGRRRCNHRKWEEAWMRIANDCFLQKPNSTPYASPIAAC